MAEKTASSGRTTRSIRGGAARKSRRCTWGRMNVVAYEVKVSRGDFARELANPAKRAAAMEVSNQFFFAAPGGLIAPAEVPEGCGLVEVRGEISTVVVPAPRREIPPPGWGFLAAVGRRGFRLVREFPGGELHQ